MHGRSQETVDSKYVCRNKNVENRTYLRSLQRMKNNNPIFLSYLVHILPNYYRKLRDLKQYLFYSSVKKFSSFFFFQFFFVYIEINRELLILVSFCQFYVHLYLIYLKMMFYFIFLFLIAQPSIFFQVCLFSHFLLYIVLVKDFFS